MFFNASCRLTVKTAKPPDERFQTSHSKSSTENISIYRKITRLLHAVAFQSYEERFLLNHRTLSDFYIQKRIISYKARCLP